jgi:outer membrane lipoprotein-sorting protein
MARLSILLACMLVAGAAPSAAQAAAQVSAQVSAQASEWGLEQLMQELAQVKSAKARFTERKHMAILSAPLDSSGTLIYTAPSRLEKHTTAPRQESMILDRDRLTLENKERNQRRSIALSDYPVVWAFVESVRSTLAGDLPTLRRFYQISFEGSRREWRLLLKPVEPAMLEVVSEIRIGGSMSQIGSVEFVEANGDHSTMTITRDTP